MPNSEAVTKKLDVIVLAAGKGKRMHQAFPGTPKVLVPLAGRSMILRVLDAIERSGIAARVTVVIGPAVAEKVKAALMGLEVAYAYQPDPKGTGHAVLCAKPELSGSANVLVLYGDQPFISAKTIRLIAEKHVESGAAVTMLTVPLPDFKSWRSSFADWGRIVRDERGDFVKSVEAKDARIHELRITEVNPSLYCFKSAWLWEHLPKVNCENVSGEYYLPDVLGLAIERGEKVNTVAVDDPRETLGANTPEQLSVLEKVYEEVKDLWKAKNEVIE